MATGNPYYVHPGNDFGQGLSALAGSVQQYGQQSREMEQQERAKQRFQEVQGAMKQAMQSGDPAQMKQVAAMYPEARESMELMFGFTNEQSEAAARQAYRQALADPENAEEYLTQGINRVSEAGGQPSNMLTDLGMLRRDPERALKSIRMAYAGIDPEGYDSMFGKGSGGPNIGQYNPRDYTTESFAEFVKTGDPAVLSRFSKQKSVDIGGVPHVFDPTIGGYRPASVGSAGGQGQGDGTVTAQDVAQSRGTIAGGEQAGKQAVETSQAAFERLEPVRQSIATIDEAISLIDQGANTGVVASKLPSVQSASVQLDNLQARLGLDVIGNTTFGALSESELNFALDTAMPKNLKPQELKKWLQRKKESQQKLADYLEDAALFLGKPGNTVADFIERKKGQSQGASKAVKWDEL